MFDIDLKKIFYCDPVIMQLFDRYKQELDHTSFRVFSHIASRVGKRTYQNSSYQIAGICRISQRTVLEKVKLLESCGLLKIEKRRKDRYTNLSNEYMIPLFEQKKDEEILFFLHWYLDLYGLKPTEFRLLCHLLSYPNCEIQQSKDFISNYCGFKKETIRKTANKLEEYKMITIKVEGNNKKFYKVQDVKNWISPDNINYSGSKTDQKIKNFLKEERNKVYERITKQKVETIKKELWKLNHDLGIIKMTDQDQLAKFQEFYQFFNSIKIH